MTTDEDNGRRVRSAGLTDRGCVRPYNQDAFLTRDDIGLWAVADGMGGHQSGDWASRTVVRQLDSIKKPGDLVDAVRVQLQEANRRIIAEARRRGPGVVIATTVVALIIGENRFACLWAGDSRLYLHRDGRLFPVSRDHSEVQSLVDAGLLSREEAPRHPRSNVVTRAIGIDRIADVEMVQSPLEPGDRFLLCSDGITGMIPEPEVGEILRSGPPETAARSLLDVALARGADDNITAIVVVYEAGEDGGDPDHGKIRSPSGA